MLFIEQRIRKRVGREGTVCIPHFGTFQTFSSWFRLADHFSFAVIWGLKLAATAMRLFLLRPSTFLLPPWFTRVVKLPPRQSLRLACQKRILSLILLFCFCTNPAEGFLNVIKTKGQKQTSEFVFFFHLNEDRASRYQERKRRAAEGRVKIIPFFLTFNTAVAVLSLWTY